MNSDFEAQQCRIVSSLTELVDEGAKFACIYADPPWQYRNRSSRGAAENHYKTIDHDGLCRMPIEKLAATDAHLHLWTTSSHLSDALELIEAWGFQYKSSFVWLKDGIGLGNYWRLSHEFVLLGVRGSLRFRDRSLRSWTRTRRSVHSAKPDRVREFIERASPGPYLELFARRTSPGWTSFGDQVQPYLF